LIKSNNFHDSEIAIGKDLENFAVSTGLKAIVYAYTNSHEFAKIAGSLLLNFGIKDPNDLFLNQLQSQIDDWAIYSSLVLDILENTMD
jgi:hypothetical protein